MLLLQTSLCIWMTSHNQSEGLNRVMKGFQSSKKVPLDTLVLALYQFQAYYTNEVRRGFGGLGQYHLAEAYESIKIDAQDVEYLHFSTPEEIVSKIKERSEEENEKKEQEQDKLCSEKSNKTKMQTKKYHSPSMREQLQCLKMIKLPLIRRCMYSTSKETDASSIAVILHACIQACELHAYLFHLGHSVDHLVESSQDKVVHMYTFPLLFGKSHYSCDVVCLLIISLRMCRNE